MTKAAMVAVHKEHDAVPLVQVHDELAFSVASEDEARALCKTMEEAVELKVPTPCDISLGTTWGSLVKLDE
jgi:DNA polymerase I-like protein with 3'-5' exonuclease and polymerase domains